MGKQSNSTLCHRHPWLEIVFYKKTTRITFVLLTVLSLIFVGIVTRGNIGGRRLVFGDWNYSGEISRFNSYERMTSILRVQQRDTISINASLSPAYNTIKNNVTKETTRLQVYKNVSKTGAVFLKAKDIYIKNDLTGFSSEKSAKMPTKQKDKTLSWDLEPVAKGSPFWQRLDNKSDVFLYSAHYDDMDIPKVIRLVGIARDPLPYSDVWCRFLDKDGRVLANNVPGKLYHFRGRNLRSYLGAFADCPVTDDTLPPYSLTVGKHNTPSETFHIVHYSQDLNSSANPNANSDEDFIALLRASHDNNTNKNHTPDVHNSKHNADINPAKAVNSTEKASVAGNNGGDQTNSTYRWNVTRCFPAFFGRFRQYKQVAEMVAASRALGVDYFQFYLESASPELLKLLQVLAEDGVADVLPWNLHMSGGQVHYLGQFSAIQDCLYRHLHSSRYLLFGDVDELFVPRKHDTLLPLLDELFSKNPQCGAFLFRNTFFSFMSSTKMPPTDLKSVQFIHEHNFPILTHITRNKIVHNAGDRSKPALDPRKVSAGSVHVIESLRKGFQQCSVDPSNGLLHHYRHFTYGNARKDMDTVSDPYIWRLTDLIVKDVHNLLRKINVTLTAN